MPRILFYDLETAPMKAWIWRPGEQVVRHGQLVKEDNKPPYTRIICATYCWNDDRPAKAIGWGYDEQDSGKVVKQFDELIKQADIVIGKNSDRFDNKHVNTIRMIAGGDPMPGWIRDTDDLEKQIRKYFNLPSNSLDYISSLFGLGGKIKMEFDDWIHIVEKTRGKGKAAYEKMLTYGKKDVEDTRTLWLKLESHFEPRYKAQTTNRSCKHCGTTDIRQNGSRWSGGTKYIKFICSVGHYAGMISEQLFLKNKGKIG